MEIKHVDGANKGKVFLYTLSTCIWCRKMKNFLNEQGVAYDYIDVDLLGRLDRQTAREQVTSWNPSLSFPTVIINDGQTVVLGFDMEKVKGALGL
jgi:glutaredoxin-like protein NrdH